MAADPEAWLRGPIPEIDPMEEAHGALVVTRAAACGAGPGRGAGAARRRERAVRGGVLLQGPLGLCRRLHPALQKEPLPGVEAGDRAGAHSAGHRGGASFPRDRGRPLGLSRHDRVEERGGAARAIPRSGAETSVSRPGHLSTRGAAALRDPRGALGPAGGHRRSDAAVVAGRVFPRYVRTSGATRRRTSADLSRSRSSGVTSTKYRSPRPSGSPLGLPAPSLIA